MYRIARGDIAQVEQQLNDLENQGFTALFATAGRLCAERDCLVVICHRAAPPAVAVETAIEEVTQDIPDKVPSSPEEMGLDPWY